MKVIQIGQDIDKIITFIPRITPIIGDVLSVTLRNELTNVVQSPEIEWIFFNSYVQIKLSELIMENNNTFELNIFNENDLIYIGKVVIIDPTVSVQDFPTKIMDIEDKSSSINQKIKY